jgi:hypothetical protein
MSESKKLEDQENRVAVFGEVITVKPIPTRGVSQIIIEVPEEFHVKATEMLFRKTAFIFAGSPRLNIPFGVVEIHGDQVKPMKNSTLSTNEAQPQRSGLSRKSDEIQISKWLALRCKEDDFQTFLGCRNEAQAIDKVRSICEVESRGDIQNSVRAKDLFMKEIFTPFSSFLSSETQG